MSADDPRKMQPLVSELAELIAARLPPHIGHRAFLFTHDAAPPSGIAYIGDGDRSEVIAMLKRFIENAAH